MKTKTRSIFSGDMLPRERWLVLLTFGFLIAVMGGSSRSDIASLPFFRASAVLFAFFALATTRTGTWREIRLPLTLLGLLALWMIAQLIPLPADVWSSLPGRDIIHRMDRLLGHVDRWRPISMTPSLTLNSLLALSVPAAALLLAAAIPVEERGRLWWAIWAFAMLSAAFSLFQFVAGARSAFYLYRITNEGALVGLFANRNHQALLLALGILAAGWLITQEFLRKHSRPVVVPALSGSILILILLILTIGSRQGLICGLLALTVIFGAIRWGSGQRAKAVGQRTAGAMPARPLVRVAVIVLPFVVIGGLIALFYWSDRSNAIVRLIDGDGDAAADMRFAAFGTVLGLLKSQWVLGGGFGSFAKLFQTVEPDALLLPSYFNQAHNDWLQLPIEGGLPGVLIALAGLVWLAVSLVSAVFGRGRATTPVKVEAMLLGAAFACLAICSFVDYPLRVPSLEMVAAFLVALSVKCRTRSAGIDEAAKPAS